LLVKVKVPLMGGALRMLKLPELEMAPGVPEGDAFTISVPPDKL
jgi:hypothetical protein